MWITKEAYCTFAIKCPWPLIQTWPCGLAFDWICSLFRLTVIKEKFLCLFLDSPVFCLNNMPSVYYTTNKHLEGCIYNFPSRTQHLFKAQHWIEKIRYFFKIIYSQFWELTLLCEELALCFKNHSRYCLWLLKWKPFKSITKHLMSGPLVKQLLLFSPETWCFLRWLKRTVSHKTWHYMYM